MPWNIFQSSLVFEQQEEGSAELQNYRITVDNSKKMGPVGGENDHFPLTYFAFDRLGEVNDRKPIYFKLI